MVPFPFYFLSLLHSSRPQRFTYRAHFPVSRPSLVVLPLTYLQHIPLLILSLSCVAVHTYMPPCNVISFVLFPSFVEEVPRRCRSPQLLRIAPLFLIVSLSFPVEFSVCPPWGLYLVAFSSESMDPWTPLARSETMDNGDINLRN